MKRQRTGDQIILPTVDEQVRAFVPKPLPPEPALVFDPQLQELNDQAWLALGRLDSAASFLPETRLFLYQYIRKEALLSSQIEGTQSSLSELMLFELESAPGIPAEDVKEISRYVAALEHGLARMQEGFPLSLRLIKEMHAVLLAKGRGGDKDPGEFRRSQNWLGGTRPGNALFVPPPPDRVMECMGQLEVFLHEGSGLSPLVKAALAHAQFETIHPFLDGNGRLGRLLITLILAHAKVLKEPLLYLSLYLKAHRDEYYERLQKVRVDGDWEAWLAFFFTAVQATATQGALTAQRLQQQAEEDRSRIATLGRPAGSALRIHQVMLERPIVTAPLLGERTGLVANTVVRALRDLEGLGIVREITGRRRNRAWAYSRCLEIIGEGTEPLAPLSAK